MKKRRVTLVVLVIVVSLGTVALSASSALASGDVNERSCPNEANTGFTSALPDCRAYEQVTPTFKNGFGAGFTYLSPDGEQVEWESFGAFAGAVGNEWCGVNEFQTIRTPVGWLTTALNDAPLPQFDSVAKSCTPHLVNSEGASLMLLRPAAGSVYERDIYVHEPDGGAFVPVGPMIPPSAVPAEPTGAGESGGFQPGGDFLDATPNLEHVLFTLQAQSQNLAPGVKTELWPGDTTALSPKSEHYTPSLYEYVGTNNPTPTLVGVDNSGRLISDCGTAPGGWDEHGNGNHINVISDDGARVFFTAVGTGDPGNSWCSGAKVVPPVDELFARDDGVHTVSLSEPNGVSPGTPDEGCTTTECKENITNPASFRDANFEKASSDGSKVFFTSTQQLLNRATQDSNEEDSAVPRGPGYRPVQKGCDVTPQVSSGTTGPNGCNLYEYDFDENPITDEPIGLQLVSGGDSSGLGPQVQGVAAVSEDGSHVYFVAKGELTKKPNEFGDSAIAGENNLYVNDTTTGQTTFIATLAESDDFQWTFNAGGGPMNVTNDGDFLVFTSSAHLVAGDNSTVQQVFRYDATTGELVRISLGNGGRDGVGASGIRARHSANPSEPESLDSDSHPAVSEDGGTVVFFSSEALVPQAPTNNQCEKEEEGECKSYIGNVYEYHGGHLYLIAGDADEPAAISESGRDIMFVTPEALVPQDGDTVADIYDARVDGGFGLLGGGAPCGGEGCQGASGGQSEVLTAPGSVTFFGPGDVAPPASTVTPKPKPRTLTRADKLANALHTCRQKRKQARTSCESAARRKYRSKAKKAGHNGRTSR